MTLGATPTHWLRLIDNLKQWRKCNAKIQILSFCQQYYFNIQIFKLLSKLWAKVYKIDNEQIQEKKKIISFFLKSLQVLGMVKNKKHALLPDLLIFIFQCLNNYQRTKRIWLPLLRLVCNLARTHTFWSAKAGVSCLTSKSCRLGFSVDWIIGKFP